MSAVSTAIRVQDQTSSVVQKMNRALMIVINTMEKLNRVSSDPIDMAGLNSARNGLAQVEVAMEDVTRSIRQAQEEQERYGETVRRSEGDVGSLASKVGKLVATYATAQTAKAALDYSDELANTTARLSLMAREGENVSDINEKIYASANRARSAYDDTADMVAKLGILAGNAFGSTDEVIMFAEQLNKNFKISGTETTGIQAAMLQLTQAMASGVLRGEEFNSIMDQAPTVIQTIADYMDVSTGQLKEMAGEGLVTAEVVKAALIGAAEETDAKFNSMTVTFSDVWNVFKNKAGQAMDPVWQRLRQISDSEELMAFATNAGRSIGTVANIIITVFDRTAQLGGFIANNWAMIAPVIGAVLTIMALYNAALIVNNTIQAVSNMLKTVAAVQAVAHGSATAAEAAATTGLTASQMAFNAALYACPLTWILVIIIAIIAAIFLVIAAINKATGSSISATGVIAGALAWVGTFLYNNFLSLLDLVLGVINMVANQFISFANFLANVMVDPVGAIIHLFGDMGDGVLGILETIASAIDKIFGSNLSDAVSGWRSSLSTKVDDLAEKYGNGKYEKKIENIDLSSSTFGLERRDLTDAYSAGYSWGKGVSDKFSIKDLTEIGERETGADYDTLLSEVAGIGDNTKDIKNSVDVSEEDLKYLKELAERETINRFTTAEITVEMGGVVNNLGAGDNIDGFMDVLTDKLYETMSVASEGVHE